MDASYTTGLQHIGIPTNCLDTSIKFYMDLGFEPFFKTDTVIFMKLHSLLIELYESKEVSGKAGAIDHISLNVKDIESVLEYIKSLKFKILDEEIQALPFFEKGVRFFTIEGPNAEKIEFNQIG
ncbi:VOC family protein [Geosporobacter ferrireducens]|uniref:Glyoxalase n=1 Tax=Geosporobacter ferrireducens TaxID=1424294 RepID=A0A1D8GFA7_9FIRM|nr:VOC family protein [Geosporobacter ferrireducens]AOT69589.1 glyoxalase [Geosporobacter ferrireducens]MTI54716.1 VOC family protein [Geosporobacter ferrireducens]